MKNLFAAFIVLTFSAQAYAGVCSKLTSINEELDSTFWKNANVKTIAEIPHTSPTHDFKEFDIISDMLEGNRCEKSMIKTIFTIKTLPGQVFETVISNEDNCDGGNSYGIIKSLNSDKVIATVEDSFINCLDRK